MANPWAVVTQEPLPDQSGDDPWAVVSVSVPKGVTAVSPTKRSLTERFQDNAEDAFRRGTLAGAAADAMAGSVLGPGERERNRDDADLYRQRSEADPFYEAGNPLDVLAAGAATLGGQIVGSLPSPESWIGLGKGSLARRAATSGAVAGATDVPVQALSIEAGAQDEIDPWRVVSSAAIGGVLPVGEDVARAAGRAAVNLARGAGKKTGGPMPSPQTSHAAANEWSVVEPAPIHQAQPAAPSAQKASGAATGWEVVNTSPPAAAPATPRPSPPTSVTEADARGVITELFPSAPITSVRRTAERNAAVGGAERSYHLSGQAMDFVPPKGTTVAQVRAALEARGLPVAELLDEGDHFHWAWGSDAKSLAPPRPINAGGFEGVPERPFTDIPETGDQGDGFTVDWAQEAAANRPQPQATPLADDIPIPARPDPDLTPDNQALSDASAPDVTDRALDALRNRERVKVDQGPSLMEYLARNGGLADPGGELSAADADIWHRSRPFMNRLTREDGLNLGDAAVRAQEAGYLPERFSDGDNRATPEDLLQAIRDELAGKPVFAREDATNAELRQHMDDLDEVLGHLGINPETADNASIKAAMAKYFAGPDPRRDYGAMVEDVYGSPTVRDEAAAALPTDPPPPPSGKKTGGLMPDAMATGRALPGRDPVPAPASQRTGQSENPNAVWLREEVSAPPSGPLADRIARGERQARDVYMGPGAKQRVVDQADIRDVLPDAHQGPLYHQTNTKGAEGLLTRTLGGLRRHTGVYVSPKRDLALGQKGKGVVLEFEPSQVNGYRPPSLANDVTANLFGSDAELVVTKTLKPAVRAITTSTAAQMEKLRANRAIASFFDFENAKPEGKGFRIERKRPLSASAPVSSGVNVSSPPQRLAMTTRAPQAGPRPEALQRLRERIGAASGPSGRGAPARPSQASAATSGEVLATKSISGLRDAPRPGAVPKTPADKARSVASVSKLARDLRAALNIPHRQGRLSIKGGALGEFDVKSGVVRTKAAQEMDVLAHEATHALEYSNKVPSLPALLAKHEAALKPMAYAGADPSVQRQEGFAEWGRWYLTNPDVAKREAPAFYADFEKALAKDDPELLGKLHAIQWAYRDMLKSASVDVARSALAYTGEPGLIGRMRREVKERGYGGAFKEMFDDAYTAFLDDLHPVNKAVRELQGIYAANHGKRLDLKTAENPYALARLARDSYAAGQVDLLDGVVPYRGLEPASPSFSDAIETAMGNKGLGKWNATDLEDFDAYLISRRMTHLWDRYSAGDLPRPPDRFTKEFHQQVIADHEAAHPAFKDGADKIYAWNQALWRKEFEAGLITEEAYTSGLRDHPDYVPLMRDLSDKGAGGGSPKPKGTGQFSGGVRQLRGSTRDVVSPLSSMTRRAFDLNTIIRRNDVLKALDDLGQAAGVGSGAIVERLPANEIEAIHVNAVEALKKAADQAGLSERDVTTLVAGAEALLEGQADVTMFKAAEFGPRKGESVVFVWRGGKKTPLLLPDGEFGKSMFDAFTGMNKEARSAMVDVMAATTSLLRQGVTLSPEFMTRNLVRDQLATWINTDVGFKPVISTIKGGISEVRRDSTARSYAVAGGLSGGVNLSALRKPHPLTDAEAKAQLQSLRKKGYRLKRYSPIGPHGLNLRGLASLTDLSEVSTRLGVFSSAVKAAKKRGLNDWEATLEGAFTARDYMDFGRRGSRMVAASRLVTFMNASLQSLDKAARVQGGWGNLKRVVAPALGRPPATDAERRALTLAIKATAKMAALGVFGGALAAMYADDPDWKDINQQLRATHWFAKINGEWISIPKPFELAEFSNIVERAYEAAVLKDPRAREHAVSDFLHVMAPPHAIPAVAVPVGIASNRDHLGRPIVPDYLRGSVDPELQVNAFTSALAKRLSAAIGQITDATGERRTISPAVIDYVVTGFGGSLGRYLLQASSYVEEKATGKPSTASGPEDMFITRGFVRDVTRSSNSQNDFWDLISKDGGKLTRAEGTFRSFLKAGQDAKATDYLNAMEPQARAYTVARVFSNNGSAKLHPLVRAQEAVSVIGEVRRDLRDDKLVDARGEKIPLSPVQRMEVDDLLAQIARAEMRSALVVTGAKGWKESDLLPAAPVFDALSLSSPEAARVLQQRMAAAKVRPLPQSMAWWGNRRDELEARVNPQTFGRTLSRERLQTPDRWEKMQERNRLHPSWPMRQTVALSSGARRVDLPQK